MQHIRNFSIIAHVDHGKSTLADRMLEITGAIDERQMKEQMLDTMDLERERGITIKMQPVSITYTKDNVPYTLNLIDTPGHIDFSYEVSRSLRAVEGVVLLIDATQGIQAQTLSVLGYAQDLGLTIIPVLSKIDMAHARIDDISLEVSELLNTPLENIRYVSGKTGEGVRELLDTIIDTIPAPTENPIAKDIADDTPRALVFDFSYTSHSGIIAYARIFSGAFTKGDQVRFKQIQTAFSLKDIGTLTPDASPTKSLGTGMIGYFTTGIKEPGVGLVGDTITPTHAKVDAFKGYEAVVPVIWASLYPQDANDYTTLSRVLKELHLSDASFTFEEEWSGILGKGFRCGFLGMLHLEIITEQIRRTVGGELIITTPSTDYTVTTKNGETTIISTPSLFPDTHEIAHIKEPWVAISIITPSTYVPVISQLFAEHEGSVTAIEDVQNQKNIIKAEMPLRELMRNFFDKLKSATSGYASLSYRRIENRDANVTRLDVLLAEEPFPAFSNIVSRARGEREARALVETIHKHLPRAMFVIKIQATLDGRIVASKTLSALRKDVTAKLYGGDVTRKMKLREKQKKGKKKMKDRGSVRVPHDVFLKVMKEKGTS